MSGFSEIYNNLNEFLNLRLFVIDDSPLTLKKIILALILLALGWVISKWISRNVAQRLLLKFGISAGEASAFKMLFFYILLVLWVFIVLNFVHVPLTIFTVLGGVVAIGVGFGSQNIMNNFISGLILLLERPIRVGDIIEIEDKSGKVVQIGARSTKILLFDNIDFVVPNSVLLEKSFNNLTLSDDKIRSKITVTVDYGCQIEKVQELLLKIAQSHTAILKDPAPNVILTDLSTDGLVFNLFIWTLLSAKISKTQVESDVRSKIYNMFAEHGIVLTYQLNVALKQYV
ncbi:MAG: mechanosensitive ion channel [Deltaproteobacteria bacterium]|nr:mechanosensitive ion channel [Deltaproteobacteria bacterium]